MKTKKQKIERRKDVKQTRSCKAGLTNLLNEPILTKRAVKDLSLFFLEESLCSDYEFNYMNRVNY